MFIRWAHVLNCQALHFFPKNRKIWPCSFYNRSRKPPFMYNTYFLPNVTIITFNCPTDKLITKVLTTLKPLVKTLPIPIPCFFCIISWNLLSTSMFNKKIIIPIFSTSPKQSPSLKKPSISKLSSELPHFLELITPKPSQGFLKPKSFLICNENQPIHLFTVPWSLLNPLLFLFK